MLSPLRLSLTDYVDVMRWRWVLHDARGHFLADHTVRLDPASREYAGFVEVGRYLDYHQPITPPQVQLRDLGRWIGQQVFAKLGEKLWQKHASPALAVHLLMPLEAHALLSRPFELACFDNGKSFREAGVRFVYQFEGTPARPKKPSEKALRVLAAFSLPVRANPLNLRRERYGLQRLMRELTQTKGMAIELRVLQYGATRDTLREAMEEAEGWDIVQLSGHGKEGQLLLEDERGGSDEIDAEALGELLDPARERLKLLILDACYSGAGSHAAARVQVGLDAVRQEGAEGVTLADTVETRLPSLGLGLAERLDCAVLAMRYPVGDGFATELMLALYGKLLDKRQRLPAALHLALAEALEGDVPKPDLSAITPILLGARAAELQLTPPQRPVQRLVLPTVGLSIGFPPEPARFVGRLQAMLRASQALAPHNPMRGVLFYGMPGTGKSACALELAYRHEKRRFGDGHIWYQAPEADSDIAPALYHALFEIQRQLNAPELGLTGALDDPTQFRQYTLPRLKAFLEQHALLLVLDNLETLLTDTNGWRDPLWGELVATLLAHEGPSRVVLTSRRQPANLAGHPRLLVEAMHALSFAESVLLARELPRLRTLFDNETDRALLRQTLRVVQGHPKLLEFADALAADRVALAARVTATEHEITERGELLDAFFAADGTGESLRADADFVQALHSWTEKVAARLSPTARLLFAFLCRLEPEDRQQGIVEANWADFLKRLGEQAAGVEPDSGLSGLPAALEALRSAGLVEVELPEFEPDHVERLKRLLAGQAGQATSPPPDTLQDLLKTLLTQATRYTIHPGVAEAARATARPALLAAADHELGAFHCAMFQRGLDIETAGGSETVADSARRGVPYLMRTKRWAEASTLLEHMLHRDDGPHALAFALPLLRRVAAATADTERGLSDAGVLARTLWKAGRPEEAEPVLRELIARGTAQGDHRLASGAASDLMRLLEAGGRLTEALALAEELAGYTRQAKLGPWTQLLDEGRRLQVLTTMGRYDEVLEAVEHLRARMDTLPKESAADEIVDPLNVRETVLGTGGLAAMDSGRWVQALALNAEIVAAKKARGAGALDLARTHFNASGPLLRLGRFDDARGVLLSCREVFEAERDVKGLGPVFGALANLEDRTDGREAAVRFERLAMGYRYQTGDPVECAGSHNNLAGYLEHQGADLGTVLAHRLAAAVVALQMQWGQLRGILCNLATSTLPGSPPAFGELAAQVEAIPGVRFCELFDRLPRTAPDGNAAIAEVWRMVVEMRQVLVAMPPAVRAAFELDSKTALREVLAALPAQEADAILEQLRAAGLIGVVATGPDMRAVLQHFEPLLQAIAAVARGDDGPRAQIETMLPKLEEQGWRFTEAVQRIWAGEREAQALTEGIDPNSAQLVRRLLQLIAE